MTTQADKLAKSLKEIFIYFSIPHHHKLRDDEAKEKILKRAERALNAYERSKK